MTEYIKREDAIQTLEQMQWHDEDGFPIEDGDEKRACAEDWINCMSTINIVHCSECKHRREYKEYDRKYDEYVTYVYCTQSKAIMMMIGFARMEKGKVMIGICDNCRYQFSDCKGSKDSEKTECQYYGKPVVFNAKTVVEENARISAALLEAIDELCERCERHRADYWESCNGCKWFDWKGGTK